ncbi:MAG: hypothetical protein Q8M06_10720 [Methanobacteriaceae archaeon]|nr:hypothetical protein [Methanobacteriaceae archaeon]
MSASLVRPGRCSSEKAPIWRFDSLPSGETTVASTMATPTSLKP